MKAFESFDQLLKVVKEEKPKDGFSSIVSNPPYQSKDDWENSSFATSIYHHFASVSHDIANMVSLIHPSRWLSSGSGNSLDEFREIELRSPKYSVLKDYSDSEEFFSGIGIAGGICFYLWNRSKNDETVRYFFNDELQLRNTLSNGFNYFIKQSWAMSLLTKIDPKLLLNSTSEYSMYLKESPKRSDQLEDILNKETSIDQQWPTIIYLKDGLKKSKINPALLKKDVNGFKVIVSKAAHPKNGFSVGRPDRAMILNPGEFATANYILIRTFDDIDSAKNCLLYLKTDFCTLLFGILSPTQNTTPKNYSLIPDVNFVTGEILDKPGTFLDFSNPETLDDQLAAIYNLTQDERNLMTKDLKPWKDKTSVTADM